MDLIALAKAKDAGEKPRLSINFLSARMGVDTLDTSAGTTYVYILKMHQLFDHRYKTVGALYGLEGYLTGATAQRVVYSLDGGNTWTLLGSLSALADGTKKYIDVFIEPGTYHVYAIRTEAGVNYVDSFASTDLATPLGSLNIGVSYWLSKNSIDAVYVGSGVYAVFFGEYNTSETKNLNVYKTVDHGASWAASLTQARPGDITHFHTCQVDPHTKYIWASSGDGAGQCKIWCSTDKTNWTLMASGGQEYRAIGFLFETDYMYWGMDNPTNGIPSYIYRASKTDPTQKTIIGAQTDEHAIYALTRTYFPAGFLVWPVSEPGSRQTKRSLIGFYDFAKQKYYPDIADISHLGLTGGYTGVLEGAKYQDTTSGNIAITVSTDLLNKYAIGGWAYANTYVTLQAKLSY